MSIAQTAKKPVQVLVTSTSKAIVNIKVKSAMALNLKIPALGSNDLILPLEYILYICYLVQFKKDEKAKI